MIVLSSVPFVQFTCAELYDAVRAVTAPLLPGIGAPAIGAVGLFWPDACCSAVVPKLLSPEQVKKDTTISKSNA